MARMLSPEDYGLTALPAVFMAISGIFVSGGFGTALIRKPDLKEEDLSTAFYYSMAVGILCYVILFIASPWIADFYNAPVLVPLMRVTALSFLYSPLGTGQGVYYQSQRFSNGGTIIGSGTDFPAMTLTTDVACTTSEIWVYWR